MQEEYRFTAETFQRIQNAVPDNRFVMQHPEFYGKFLVHSWYNGLYLHVSGDLSLLGAVRESTYTCEPFFTTAISVGYGEQVCNDHHYKTGVDKAPEFPHMDHCDSVYSETTGSYDGVVSIPLASNLFGSDLGNGIPTVALQFPYNWSIRCQWKPEITEAIRSGTLRLEIVVHEEGWCSKDQLNNHKTHIHMRISPKFEANSYVMTEAKIENGAFLWEPSAIPIPLPERDPENETFIMRFLKYFF